MSAILPQPQCVKETAVMISEEASFDSQERAGVMCSHHDVIKWTHFPRYWPFVRGIHRSPVDSPYKSRWRGALIIDLCVNKRLSKQSGRRWFEMPSRSLWSHCNEKHDVDGIRHMNAMASQTTCNLTLCSTGSWEDNKENIKDHITRLLWQPLTKGQHCGKRFHVMTSLENYLNDVAGTLIRTMLTVKMPLILIPGFLQIYSEIMYWRVTTYKA